MKDSSKFPKCIFDCVPSKSLICWKMQSRKTPYSDNFSLFTHFMVFLVSFHYNLKRLGSFKAPD